MMPTLTTQGFRLTPDYCNNYLIKELRCLFWRKLCSVITATNASKVKTALKIKWASHPSFSSIPPQEQGMSFVNLVTANIYAVNATIKPKDASNPTKRVCSKINNDAIATSRNGINIDIERAILVRMGD